MIGLLVLLVIGALLSLNFIKHDHTILTEFILHNVFRKISTFAFITFLLSPIFLFSMVANQRIDFVIRKFFTFVYSFIMAFISYVGLIFVFKLLFSPHTYSMVRLALCPPVYFMNLLRNPETLNVFFIIVTLLLSLTCALFSYRHSRIRYSRRGTSIFFMLFAFVFSTVGLLTYLFSRNKGRVVSCPACGQKKLLKIYPCPHCQGFRVSP